jgi:very-short-patch-repair endonuclease
VGLRYRRDLRPVLEDVAAGSHSLLEIRYLRNVERRHGLPRGTRQRGVDQEFTDVAYEGFGLLVELDGKFHLRPDRQWKDLARDNRATLRSEATLRYGWTDIQSRPCEAAAQVLAVLRRTAPDLPGRPCGPQCPVR